LGRIRSGDAELRFRLLGRPSVSRGGAELSVPRGQAWLLLGFLLDRRGRTIDRSELIDVVWPGQPPAQPEVAVWRGLSEAEIANQMFISARAVRAGIAAACAKLGTESVTDAVTRLLA
jgi:hypothetical protein